MTAKWRFLHEEGGGWYSVIAIGFVHDLGDLEGDHGWIETPYKHHHHTILQWNERFERGSGGKGVGETVHVRTLSSSSCFTSSEKKRREGDAILDLEYDGPAPACSDWYITTHSASTASVCTVGAVDSK